MAKVNWDASYLEVYPRSAGDFGFASIRSNYKDGQHLEDMACQIRRHVDRVSTAIIKKIWECESCYSQHLTEVEANDCCEEGE